MQNVLNKIAITIAFVVIVVSVSLAAEHSAFEIGYNLAKEEYRQADSIKFSGGVGPTNYEFLAAKHGYIAILLSVFVVCSATLSGRLVFVINLCVLALAVLVYWQIFNFLSLMVETYEYNYFSSNPYFSVIFHSRPLVWSGFFGVILLSGFHIFLLLRTYSKSNS